LQIVDACEALIHNIMEHRKGLVRLVGGGQHTLEVV
jgi:hypothetical protein